MPESGSRNQVQHGGILGAVLAVPLVVFISTFGDWKQCALAGGMVATSLGLIWAFNSVTSLLKKAN
jgi:hypothetical protein